MKELLEWIDKEGYVQYKDGTYYKKGSYRPWGKTMFLTIPQLIDIFNKLKPIETI